jgi:primary-amine oxidase
MTNPARINPVSGKPVSYKFIPSASQLMLAHPDSIMAKRAQFAQHHVWVTKYKDGELWAGGEFTNQSKNEVGGVADAVVRNENVENNDVVVWNTFGLTVSKSEILCQNRAADPDVCLKISIIQGSRIGQLCKSP